jgi:hypothetical protein
MDSLWYGHKYGLVDDAVFDQLWNQCRVRMPTVMTLGGKHLVAAEWNRHLKSKSLRGEDLRSYSKTMLRKLASFPGTLFHDSTECRLALYKFHVSSSNALSQSWKDL